MTKVVTTVDILVDEEQPLLCSLVCPWLMVDDDDSSKSCLIFEPAPHTSMPLIHALNAYQECVGAQRCKECIRGEVPEPKESVEKREPNTWECPCGDINLIVFAVCRGCGHRRDNA